jgi:hypothetical protein
MGEGVDDAVVVLERELHWLDSEDRRLTRQIEVFPEGSTDQRGVKQALDVVKGRIAKMRAAIRLLREGDWKREPSDGC